MLAIRPTCENCNKKLPVDATDAMICTFECTFCLDCVKGPLREVCPNCGGGLVQRPIRPQHMLSKYPVSEQVIHKPVDLEAHYQKYFS
ncbi:DUF1272 domain-containing protein [Gilvibacter sp.]|uniref:DUF1272 domain-containing protein n=1 Tax=Gilvibacter sp. TaxID=2729997 RepID=UPI003F49E3F8